MTLSWTCCDCCEFCRLDVQPVEFGDQFLWVCLCCREERRID